MGPLENHGFSLISSSAPNCLRIAYAMFANMNHLKPEGYRCAECRNVGHRA